MSEEIFIRNYRKSDFDATTKLMRELSEIYNFGFDEEKWNESSGLRLFSPGSARMTLIAEMAGAVVGMGFIEVKTDPTGTKVGFLQNWGIAKEYHHKGVGRKLLDRAINIMEKMGVQVIRINFGYDINPKVLQHVQTQGFNPTSIMVEKVLKKSEIVPEKKEVVIENDV
ncbi:MAG: hypothetical protein RBG13Loki_1244 [Promethearchaeota archaeon CR_4]|nr:MAG: hypothetical protein RBG13Loki_1244 [Candidatus Lokiarchaeota archaeon CR_4]